MTELLWVLYSTGYLVFAIVLLLLAKKAFDLATPFSVNVQLTEKDNTAVGILMAGFLLGVTAVICGVFFGEGPETPSLAAFWKEIVPTALYGSIGIVLLFLSGIINDKVILREFSNQKEIIESRNSAVAIMMAATYVGSGLVIAGGICGSADIISMLVAFLLGQIAMVAFAIAYQLATSYDDQKELGENKNIAAALAFGGNLLAYSLILMKGVSMDSAVEEWTWPDRLLNIAYYAVAGCALLLITRLVNDFLFCPKARISKEIVTDRNLNAGLMEAALALAMGSAMVFCL
jgi:uncharacterized membrane protein YjfL (UPF0719 family)